MAKKRILILGAGLAGLSAAWHLQKRGIECQVFEKEPEVGGLCRSKNKGGFIFDYDGHLLHFRQRYTFNFVKGLLKNNLRQHKRIARVCAFGRYIRYPFQANLYGLPPAVIKECLLGLIKKHKARPPKANSNFLEWINYTFGEGIAEHFMVPYNVKFWTVPPPKMSCEWLENFIPVPSLNQIIEGAVEESQRQFGYNSRFWYPKKGGINQLALRLASQIRNIHTGCPVTQIDLNKKEIKSASGNKEKFDHIISTVPLPEMPSLIKDIPGDISRSFKKLRWNSVFNINLGLTGENSFGDHWVYFPQKEICFFRVGFYHNFSRSLVPPGKKSLYIEVSYSHDRPIDKSNIVGCVKSDLKKAGVITGSSVICSEDINDIKYGYPIYDIHYSKSRKNVIRYLTNKNIIPCGRYGSWRYFSMEDAVLDGKRAADLFIKC